MSNNKQNSVEWFSNQAYQLFEQYSEGNFDRINLNNLMLTATEQAKAMHKEEIIAAYQDGKESVIIEHLAALSTSNASSYSDGYSEGYKRALELVEWKIKTIK